MEAQGSVIAVAALVAAAVAAAAAVAEQPAGSTDSRQDSSGIRRMLHKGQNHSIEHTGHCNQEHW